MRALPALAPRVALSVGVVRTGSGAGSIPVINDDELLALAAPRLAALVRVGPNAQELVFVEAAEQGGAR